jgi:hypothetical protein
MALVNQNGSLVVRGGALGTGQDCCCEQCCGCVPCRTIDTSDYIYYYTCTGFNGCEQIFGPAPAPDGSHETLEECQQFCDFLGVVCEDWDYYENTYYECKGPIWGLPGSQQGPLTCEDCTRECCTVSIVGCFGGGANGSIVADDDGFGASGTITEVLLTRPGAGFAKLGRVEPTLTISGADATFQLSPKTGTCGLPCWTIDSIFIPPDSPIAMSYSEGSHRIYPGGPGVIWEEAAHVIMTVERIAPDVTVYVNDDGQGSGAVLTPTLTEFISQDAGGGSPESNTVGQRFWKVSAIAITNGGSGYEAFDFNEFQGDFLRADVTSPNSRRSPRFSFFGTVDSVDENGAITAVSVYEIPGWIPGTSTEPVLAGAFYRKRVTGAIIQCGCGGCYYSEDPELPPHVSAVTVSITCRDVINGSGAVINAVVDDDTASETFGQITELVLVNGGNGYEDGCEDNPLP